MWLIWMTFGRFRHLVEIWIIHIRKPLSQAPYHASDQDKNVLLFLLVNCYTKIKKETRKEVPPMFDDFSSLYQVVRPTVLHLMTLYHIPLWGKSDWDQEGMQVLYQLLVEAPRLRYQILRLRVSFNTKFTNHVKDALRKQAPKNADLTSLARLTSAS